LQGLGFIDDLAGVFPCGWCSACHLKADSLVLERLDEDGDHVNVFWFFRQHLKPVLDTLKQLLSETCNGVQRQDMLKEHIPVGRRWVEALHLCLNTGNHAYEVMRNALHYYLLPDGSVRDRANLDPES
jgi:hypothetical protein